MGALCGGEVSFDKVRAVVDVATPETDRELCDQARACSVRELADLARTQPPSANAVSSPARSEHDRRYLRFNDTFRTVTAQLPAESYAEAKACLEAVAREIPSDDEVSSEGETRQRARHAGTSASATPSAMSSARCLRHLERGEGAPARSSWWPTWRSAPWSMSRRGQRAGR